MQRTTSVFTVEAKHFLPKVIASKVPTAWPDELECANIAFSFDHIMIDRKGIFLGAEYHSALGYILKVDIG